MAQLHAISHCQTRTVFRDALCLFVGYTDKRIQINTCAHNHFQAHPSTDADMSANYTQFPGANEKYVANFGDKGSLPLPPGKKVCRF
jgi:hypothetical protein